MQRIKQIFIVLIIFLAISVLLMCTFYSQADGEEGLTLEKLIDMMLNNGDAYLKLDPGKVLRMYGDDGHFTPRLSVVGSERFMSGLNPRFSGCLSDRFLTDGGGGQIGAIVLAIIDVDSDGTVHWYGYDGGETIVEGIDKDAFIKAARYAVEQKFSGYSNPSNDVSKYIVSNKGIFSKYFASSFTNVGGPVNSGQDIPQGQTLRFMYIVFRYSGSHNQALQERIMFGLGKTPPRTSSLYLQKVNENGQTQKDVYFRLKHVETNKYIQVADLDSAGNPNHGYGGMDDTIVWFPDDDITQKKKTILYTDIQNDATIFRTNPWDDSGAIYIPRHKGWRI